MRKLLRQSPPFLLGLAETGLVAIAVYFAARWMIPPTAAPLSPAALIPALLAAALGVARGWSLPFARRRHPARRALVLGTGRRAAELEALTSRRQSRTAIVGYVPFAGEPVEVPSARIAGDADSLLAQARAADVRENVVALEDRRGMPLHSLLDARMEGVAVTSYLSFWERETGRLNLDSLDLGWLIFSGGFRIVEATQQTLKRILDVAASLALLVFTLPILICAAIAIRLDSTGPVFYGQQRVGRGGRVFTIHKFRTMRADAEQGCGPRWAAHNDSRITRVGGFLRRTRIDELPQILNVLRGEMSFVGPRPERPHFVNLLTTEIPYFAERHRVRPGITGWAQINYPYGASVADARAKLAYDLYYIKNFSIAFDLRIIARTIRTVLFDRGAR